MKTIVASVITAVGASACCLGPFVLSLVGAGALGAAATQFEPYRPFLLGVTFVLLASAFYVTYRSAKGSSCAADGGCTTSSNRTAKIVLWIATLLVVLLVAFPYYIEWFV